jgi:DNA-directed RNA polymerase beta' subunit
MNNQLNRKASILIGDCEMKIDIYDVDKFIRINQMEEVNDPVCLNQDRTPTSGGLFSYKIFGLPGTRERRERFAYIDLGSHVMHPLLYKLFTLMDNRIKKASEGYSSYYINTVGHMVEDPEGKVKGSGTGFKWLMENLKKIKFERTGSAIRDERISLIKNIPTDEIFLKKWPVIPAFYRDLNFAKIGSGKISMDEINEIYLQILNASAAMRRAAQGGFETNITALRLQLALVKLYELSVGKVQGKGGYFREYGVSKNIDFSARAVISTSRIGQADKYTDMEVRFSNIGIPLHIACGTFQPFIVKYVRELIGDSLAGKTRVVYGDSTVREGLQVLGETLSDTNVEKMINFFARSQEDRFNPIQVVSADGKKQYLKLFEKALKRPFTICDLLFLACSAAIADKYVYYTRYPVISHHSTNVGKPVILTTERVVTMDFSEGLPTGMRSVLGKFDNYPDITCKKLWRDAAVIDNGVTKLMDADFDGDQISIIGLFTQEANEEAKKLLNSKTALVRADGSPARSISNEATLSLYSMTRD